MNDPSLPSDPPDLSAADRFFGYFPSITVLSLGLGLVLGYQFALAALDGRGFDIYGNVMVAATVFHFILPAIFLRRHRSPVLGTLRIGRLPLSQFMWLSLLTICLVPAVEVLSQINTRFVPIPESFEQFMTELRPSGQIEWIKAIISVAILAPLGEEILFRGLMQQAARSAIGPRGAAIAVGLLFALVHMEPWYLMALVLIGITLGFVFERTGSLSACMWVHVFYNTLGLAITAWLGEREFEIPETVLASTAAIGLGVAALAYSQLRRINEWSLDALEPPRDSAER